MIKLLGIVAVSVVLFVLVELTLRSLFGFGNPILYISDEKIGYRCAPNQRVTRFGNHIEINEYSMRSAPVETKRSPSARRVLLLGDSVANGGWWTDQADTLSAMMARQLSEGEGGEGKRKGEISMPDNRCPGPQVEVLNASANSWGPRNELAYLQRFGTFEAQAVVLLMNTDDLFATAPTSEAVGRDRNYPSRKPLLASIEVFSRYLLPSPPVASELKATQAETGDRVARNLEAIRQMRKIATQNNSQFLLAMTPLRRELGEPGSRDYERQARQRLKDFTDSEQITYIDFLPLLRENSQPQTFYRDHIHLSPAGNQYVSETLSKALRQVLAIACEQESS